MQEKLTTDERTQQILAERIGMLLIGSARLQAELEAARQIAAAAAKASGTLDGARGADGPEREGVAI